MEPQTVTELRRQVARIKAAFAQALENRNRADTNRLQAILDKAEAERELAAHVTKETKTNLKTVKRKTKTSNRNIPNRRRGSNDRIQTKNPLRRRTRTRRKETTRCSLKNTHTSQ